MVRFPPLLPWLNQPTTVQSLPLEPSIHLALVPRDPGESSPLYNVLALILTVFSISGPQPTSSPITPFTGSASSLGASTAVAGVAAIIALFFA